jgi:hypothetical protein
VEYGTGSASAINTTIAYNQAVGGAGGAGGAPGSEQYASYASWGATGAGGNAAGGGLSVGDGDTAPNSVILANTIVALNTAGGGAASDISGTVDPQSSYNLIGTGGSGGLANGISGNLVGFADPRLGALADNGGPTKTIALLGGSPAFDAGDNALAVDPANLLTPLTTDQRGTGFPRILDGQVDIGAVEISDYPTLTSASAAVTVNEGSQATNTGTFDDIDGRVTVTLAASVGTVTQVNASGAWSWSYTPFNYRGAPTSVTVTANDSSGHSASVTFGLTVKNVSPTITKFSVPATAKAGETVTLSGTATDPGTDTLGYQWVIYDPPGGSTPGNNPLYRNSTVYHGATVHVVLPRQGTYDVYLVVGDGDLGTVWGHAQIVVT